MITYKTKPKFWVSLITGNKFPYKEYANHGKVIEYRGFKDLPENEYPFTIEYEEPLIPIWMK